jgi:hypothetical protein
MRNGKAKDRGTAWSEVYRCSRIAVNAEVSQLGGAIEVVGTIR